MIARAVLVALCLLGSASVVPAKDVMRAVGPVPDALRKAWKLDRFYQKHVDVHGFPVLGSKKVSDHALLEAAWIIERMVGERRDLLKTLAKAKVRCCVMAHDEVTTDVPEHMTLEPGKWWDKRARGLGASKERPCVSCAEENLLEYPGDPYAQENILVHEFAHAIDIMALRTLDKTFEQRLDGAYRAAMKDGLWKGLYAAENKEEYWAEGVQSWFDTNRPPDAEHNHVDTREELEAYDPRLAKLLAGTFPENAWRYAKPSTRPATRHLAGFDRSEAPRFRWPKGLVAWYRRYEAAKRTGAGRVALPMLSAGDAPRRSPTSLDETRILFVNETQGVVELFWVDHVGGRRSYGTLRAGAVGERSTLVGHVWVVVDATGRDLARFVAARKPGRARIRAPAATR
ncbi:MAG: hypothetical protein QNJ90_10065 [Planctomycetota bacterium]|nr:hypothetical protein [Planctomycetota bacterium]